MKNPGRIATLMAVILGMVLAVTSLTTATADIEPNDSRESAQVITVGTDGALAGSIAPAGDEDFFQFVGVAGHTYVAELLNVSTSLNSMRLTAYDLGGAVLASTSWCQGTGNVCARIEFTTGLDGTYVLRARAASTAVSGTYTIRVLPRYDQGLVPADDGEPNDVAALAGFVGVGTSSGLTATVSPRDPRYVTVAGDEDYYRFTGVADRTYVVELLNVAKSVGGMRLTAYDASGTELASTRWCQGTANICARIEFTTSLDGTYLLRARAASDAASGTYTIRVLPRYDQGLIRAKSGEPNDSASLAARLKVGTTHAQTRSITKRNPKYVTVAGDEDYYRFTGVADRTYVVELLNVAKWVGGMRLTAYDASGTELASTRWCQGTANICARIEFTTSLDGTYLLRARAASDAASGTYTIRVLPRYDQGLIRAKSGEPNDSASLAARLKVGTTHAQTRSITKRNPKYVTVAGDEDYYRFAGRADRTYLVELTSVARSVGSMHLTVYDSSGIEVESTSWCNRTGRTCARLRVSSSVSDTFFVRAGATSDTASGKYRIRVRPYRG